MNDLEQYMQDNHSYTPKVKDIDPKDEGSPQDSGRAYHAGVITGKDFQTMLRHEIGQMSDHDIDLLTKFCIQGSRRLPDQLKKAKQNLKRREEMKETFTRYRDKQKTQVARRPPINEAALYFDCDFEKEVIQFHYFQRALDDIYEKLTKKDRKSLDKDAKKERKIGEKADDKYDVAQSSMMATRSPGSKQVKPLTPEQHRRENQLIEKITSIFRQRECTFFDAFKEVYDPLKSENRVSMKVFKEKVQKLHLPLTVQDQRILRRIAQGQGQPRKGKDRLKQKKELIGTVDLKKFCPRFETRALRDMRLNKTLDRLATAFYLQNLNL
jgi:hypothetical protein